MMDYPELLDKLADVDNWLFRLGIKSRPNDRLHLAMATISEVKEKWIASKKTGVKTRIGDTPNYIFALAELLEFLEIYEAFEHESGEVLTTKMRVALSGPFEPERESRRNNPGRNVMFELALATEWRRRGLRVSLGEPDIILEIDGKLFVVECKRPFSWAGVTSALDSGRSQLRKQKLDAISPTAVGVIAISLSRIVVEGWRMLFVKSDEDRGQLTDMVDTMLSSKSSWASIRFHERIAAVLFHVSMPTDVGGGKSFMLTNHSNLYPAGAKEADFAALKTRIIAAYARQP